MGEVRLARRLLPSEHEAGLRLLDLRLGLGNRGLLQSDLRIDAADAVLRRRDLRFGLSERDALLAIVDARDRAVFWDTLIRR
jgi:hypothetical protein